VVDVTGARHRRAGDVVHRRAVDAEPAGAQGGEADRAGRRLAEDDVRGSGEGVDALRADDDIGEAVAVDIPGSAHGASDAVVPAGSVDAEAARARRGQVHAGESGLAEDDVGRPRGARRPDDHIADAIAVDVSRGGQALARRGARRRAVDPDVGLVQQVHRTRLLRQRGF
jgi:hypothetical protein